MVLLDLADTTYRRIAEEFIGDDSSSNYKYKSGANLVAIFNNHFNFDDKYANGFPSRWFYVSENIKLIGIDSFFKVILSSKYLRVEEGYIRDNVNDAIVRSLTKFNEILDSEDIKIIWDEHDVLIQEIFDDEFIGQGGFAKVYFNRQSNRVTKILNHMLRQDDSASSRFKREFEITSSLSDISGIIKVYEFDTKKMQYEMDHCEFTLEKYKPYERSDDIKRKIIGELLSIMSTVHSRDVMHRDLTPNNIFIENNHVIIGDFGLGKDLTADYSRYTQDTRGVGQFNYIAPEQDFSLKKASFEADVYSIGKIMNFILTGSPINYNHECKYITQKATAQDTHNRYKNAEVLKDAYKFF